MPKHGIRHVYARVRVIVPNGDGSCTIRLYGGTSFRLPAAAEETSAKIAIEDYMLIDLTDFQNSDLSHRNAHVFVFRRDKECPFYLNEVTSFIIGGSCGLRIR